MTAARPVRRCAVCNCTETSPCVAPDGSTCRWVAPDLCDFCAQPMGYEANLNNGAVDAEFVDDPPRVELYTEGDLNQLLASMGMKR